MNRLQKITLMVGGALLLMFVLWAVFGTKGDAKLPGSYGTTAGEAVSVSREKAEVTNHDVSASDDTATEAGNVVDKDGDAIATEVEDAADEDVADKGGDEGVAETRTDEPEKVTKGDGADVSVAELVATRQERLRGNRYLAHLDSMPDQGCRKLHINLLPGGTLHRVFADSNKLHLDAANKIGIRPLTGDLRSAWSAGEKLVAVETCEEFYVDDLKHSLPYLVPEARDLLKEIGRNFNDSLSARGGGAYRIKATSLLRTSRSVKRLRRHNGNAVETSAHLYGTTFDISYSQFICDNDSLPRTSEDLKNLLAEVIYDLRDRGRCYVKHERRQACFHITAR